MFNLLATSSTISASTAESNLHLSGPLHPCSDNDGRAVPELKGVQLFDLRGTAEYSPPEDVLSLLQG